ncbi:uracil-DNA glycosylase [Microbacterium sp.]|uniref:uracil-DNA glycosylase n=1 Tax=Microbacterium sp. TaxID=51671 RepID=UPI0026038276|nr:uracil-DNA glycosylase [Microbacterium sp.]
MLGERVEGITGDDFSSLPVPWATELGLSASEVNHLHDTIDLLYDPAGPVTCPPRSAVFRAFGTTSPRDVRVVILGQDPYPAPCVADGLAFSAPNGILTPKSLGAVFDALTEDLGTDFVRPDEYSPDLSRWAAQGVLLLNTALTVRNGKAGSHLDVWADFTDGLLRYLSSTPEVSFLLWGEKAQNKARKAGIGRLRPGVFRAAHPRASGSARPLATSKHFSKCNSFLASVGVPTIDWSLA